jgi:hypothetical protein
MGGYFWRKENSPTEKTRHVIWSTTKVILYSTIALTCRLNLEPPNPHPRQSRFLTSFDELFKPELPSSQRYPFREDREIHDEELRNQIRQGMEDSIIPSVQATPVKSERVPLKERIRGLINSERPKRRRRGWLEKIVGKKRLQGKVYVPKECI